MVRAVKLPEPLDKASVYVTDSAPVATVREQLTLMLVDESVGVALSGS
jgi:hypothetical protein